MPDPAGAGPLPQTLQTGKGNPICPSSREAHFKVSRSEYFHVNSPTILRQTSLWVIAVLFVYCLKWWKVCLFCQVSLEHIGLLQLSLCLMLVKNEQESLGTEPVLWQSLHSVSLWRQILVTIKWSLMATNSCVIFLEYFASFSLVYFWFSHQWGKSGVILKSK